MILTPQESWEFSLLALCVWRESRGEIVDAKRAVAWSIRNRAMRPTWWGTDYPSVILKHVNNIYQYSSFNTGDPNAVKFPEANDTAWQACLMAAESAYEGVGGDPSLGATHYFDRSLDGNPPAWAAKMIHTANIGNLRFYR
jgi:N-acetylmuramoyl-L-alanine amidase